MLSPRAMRDRSGLGLGVLFSVAVTACSGAQSPADGRGGEPPEADECNLALSAIRASSQRIGSMKFSGNDTAQLLEQLAQYGAVAAEEAELLSGVELDHAELNAVMRGYVQMTRDVARAAAAMAQSVEEQNALGPELQREPTAQLQARMVELERQQDAATEQLGRAAGEELPLLDRIQSICSR